MDVPSKTFYLVSPQQKVAGGLAVTTAFISFVMTVAWANNTDEANGYLGGYNARKLIFNWHPTLMVAGFIFFFVSSLLSYRMFPFPKKFTKAFHTVTHTSAIICIALGLTAVFVSHNNSDKHEGDIEYYANMVTLHDLIGIAAVALYVLNYFLGFIHFLTPLLSDGMRKLYMPNHIFLGVFTFFVAVFAVETGVLELNTYNGCDYAVAKADLNPASNYHLLNDGCQLSNGIGIMVLLTAFLCSYALIGPGLTVSSPASLPKEIDEEKENGVYSKLIN